MSDVTRDTNAPDDASRYPGELARLVHLGDGSTLVLRAVRPDDAAGLRVFHEHLSRHTTYLRFFNVHPELSAEELEHFTCVDYHDRLALVLEDDGKLRAICRYERIASTDEAEVAFVVADELQHRGIGTILLKELAAAATARGITAFVATTLAENRSMLEVFWHSGYPVTSTRDREAITLHFSIRPQDRTLPTTTHDGASATPLVIQGTQPTC